MKPWIPLTLVAFALAPAACSSSTGDTGGDGGDASTLPDSGADGDATAHDGAPDADADAGYCCPPDPHPGCTMHYGGWSESNGGCGWVSDGMPWPNDPAWHLVTDSHGCSMWSSAGSTGSLCGSPRFDAGDAGDSGGSGDAGDASQPDDAGDAAAADAAHD
jgi:hypothetical protein